MTHYPLINDALKAYDRWKIMYHEAIAETFPPGTVIQWQTIRGCWITEKVTRTEGENVFFTKGGEGEQKIYRHYMNIRKVESEQL